MGVQAGASLRLCCLSALCCQYQHIPSCPCCLLLVTCLQLLCELTPFCHLLSHLAGAAAAATAAVVGAAATAVAAATAAAIAAAATVAAVTTTTAVVAVVAAATVVTITIEAAAAVAMAAEVRSLQCGAGVCSALLAAWPHGAYFSSLRSACRHAGLGLSLLAV